jgi:hypothetical protein
MDLEFVQPAMGVGERPASNAMARAQWTIHAICVEAVENIKAQCAPRAVVQGKFESLAQAVTGPAVLAAHLAKVPVNARLATGRAKSDKRSLGAPSTMG